MVITNIIEFVLISIPMGVFESRVAQNASRSIIEIGVISIPSAMNNAY